VGSRLNSIVNVSERRSNNNIEEDAAEDQQQPRYAVHYLAPCHQVPGYSWLHVVNNLSPSSSSSSLSDLANVVVDLETLDCSPTCRYEQDVLGHSVCESDLFLDDPLKFINERYGAGSPYDDTDDQMTMHLPDFVVLYRRGREIKDDGEEDRPRSWFEARGYAVVGGPYWHTFDEQYSVLEKTTKREEEEEEEEAEKDAIDAAAPDATKLEL
jgi:hypothetical protein